MEKNVNEIYVIEYSVSQKSFHAHTLQEMINTNRSIVSEGRSLDYLPIGFAQAHEGVEPMIELLKKQLKLK